MEKTDDMVLRMQGISKRFAAIQALDNVQFELKKGEVHALLGENGAGKSTFLNIMSGAYKQDAGTLEIDHKEVEFKNPHAAKQHGIAKVHQELQLIPEMTVAQNIFLGNEPTNQLGAVDFKLMEEKADEMLKKLEADFSGRTITKKLSTAQMQMVEIAKALLFNFNILALDEPTASLTTREIKQLFRMIQLLKEQGKAIIYISHRMEEIFEICDRATVFRDGKYVGTVNVAEVTKDDLVRMMVGRDISNEFFNKETKMTKEVVLELQNLSNGTNYRNISLQLHKGEILGLSGLVGAGRTELVRAIFGADKFRQGTVFVNGKERKIKCPKDAIRAGIMLIPEDRKLQGFVGSLTNSANVALSNLDKYTYAGVINHRKLKKKVTEITDKLNVHPGNNDILTGRLSGGNQQKIVVAKALNVEPEILILDEPTRGIDVNAKREIHQLIKNLANSGKSIIVISSELPEILCLSDRVIIMYEGNMTGEIQGKEATENDIMRCAMGGN